MRNILFKAKRKDNGEWVEGYYVKTMVGYEEVQSDLIYIPKKHSKQLIFGYFKIDPETLCQNTGEDDGEEEIWENDIYSLSRKGNILNCSVEYYDGAFWFVDVDDSSNSMALHTAFKNGYVCDKLGNKIDNPELLGFTKIYQALMGNKQVYIRKNQIYYYTIFGLRLTDLLTEEQSEDTWNKLEKKIFENLKSIERKE